MTLEKFKEYLEIYKKINDNEENLNKDLYQMSPDFGGFYLEDVHIILDGLLKDIMKDEDNWIEYYIYELNWGKDYEDGCIQDKNGNNIPLKTIEDLYNLLTGD